MPRKDKWIVNEELLIRTTDAFVIKQEAWRGYRDSRILEVI